jgi:hypothetical protein
MCRKIQYTGINNKIINKNLYRKIQYRLLIMKLLIEIVYRKIQYKIIIKLLIKILYKNSVYIINNKTIDNSL